MQGSGDENNAVGGGKGGHMQHEEREEDAEVE